MLGEEEWALLRTTGDYSSAGVVYTVLPVGHWELNQRNYPANRWEELARGTEAEMRTMHRLAKGDTYG